MNVKEQNIISKIKSSRVVQWLKNVIGGLSKQTIRDILILILIGVVLYAVIFINKIPSEVTDALKDNKKIEKQIDSIRVGNEILIQKIRDLESTQLFFVNAININNELINQNNNELIKLKKMYNEKINSINNYNVKQLDSFFTKRYGQFYR